MMSVSFQRKRIHINISHSAKSQDVWLALTEVVLFRNVNETRFRRCRDGHNLRSEIASTPLFWFSPALDGK